MANEPLIIRNQRARLWERLMMPFRKTQGGGGLVDVSKATATVAKPVADSTFFGAGQPQAPMGPPKEAFRALDYEVGRNIRTTIKDYGVSYWELRQLARYHDVTRLLIETRKDQMEALDWAIRPINQDKTKDTQAPPDDDQQNRVGATTRFMRFPDGETHFPTWLRKLVEDVLVIDAPTVYVNRTKLFDTRFEVIDGATIRRVVDSQGRTPDHPEVAYQQIIKGMPAWNFTRDELIWLPRNPGADRMYGFGPVEQIIITVNIALRRQFSTLQYFTEGNIPDALISTPENWTPDQIMTFQEAWDALHEGNTAQRRHAKFVPGGTKMTQTREVVLKNEFDEWLARVACYAFSIAPTAFTKAVNRATAETAKEAALQEGLAPLMRWAKQFIDLIIQKHLGQYDLEFTWGEQDASNPVDVATIQDKKLRNGTLTINESRAEDGKSPVAGGDVPMIYMGAAPIPVHVAAAVTQEPAAGGVAPASAPVGEPPAGHPPAPPPKGGPPAGPASAKPEPAEQAGKQPPAEKPATPATAAKPPPQTTTQPPAPAPVAAPEPPPPQDTKPPPYVPLPGAKKAAEADLQKQAAFPVVETHDQLLKQVSVIDPSPTPGQKSAGNYRKAHVTIAGMPITLENARGSIRSKQDVDGNNLWAVVMPDHYGYINGTVGHDGDHVDCFVGHDHTQNKVWVIDQHHLPGQVEKAMGVGDFDEHKAMLWYPSRKAAMASYDASFSDGSGPTRRKGAKMMPMSEFKAWVDSGDKDKPVSGLVLPSTY